MSGETAGRQTIDVALLAVATGGASEPRPAIWQGLRAIAAGGCGARTGAGRCWGVLLSFSDGRTGIAGP